MDLNNYRALKYGTRQILPSKTPISKFLTIPELLYLNKKGLVLYDDLTEQENNLLTFIHSEKYLGEGYELMTRQEIKDKEEYCEKLYKNKRMEIMIEALFLEKFELDDQLLSSDISLTYPIYPEHYEKINVDILRATDRLKDNRFYYKAKKENTNNIDEDI